MILNLYISTTLHQDVAGSDVTMREAQLVQVRQRAEHLAHEGCDNGSGEVPHTL